MMKISNVYAQNPLSAYTHKILPINIYSEKEMNNVGGGCEANKKEKWIGSWPENEHIGTIIFCNLVMYDMKNERDKIN